MSLLTNNYPKILCTEENILFVMYILMSWLYFFSSNQPLVLYKYGRKDHVVDILHYNIFGHFSWGGVGGSMGTSYWFFPSLARLKSINLMWFSGLMLQRIFTFLEHAPTSMRTKTAIMPTIWERGRQDSVHYRYSCILLGAGNKTHRVTKIGIFIIQVDISNILIGQIFKNQI